VTEKAAAAGVRPEGEAARSATTAARVERSALPSPAAEADRATAIQIVAGGTLTLSSGGIDACGAGGLVTTSDGGAIGDVSEGVLPAMGNICYFASKGIGPDGEDSHPSDPDPIPKDSDLPITL
jgi:hypothetical protein